VLKYNLSGSEKICSADQSTFIKKSPTWVKLRTFLFLTGVEKIIVEKKIILPEFSIVRCLAAIKKTYIPRNQFFGKPFAL
jgi:hypothetical protein